ncbi:MAG: hypothetical protein WDA22_03705 [Bacteroidota bacterium]
MIQQLLTILHDQIPVDRGMETKFLKRFHASNKIKYLRLGLSCLLLFSFAQKLSSQIIIKDSIAIKPKHISANVVPNLVSTPLSFDFSWSITAETDGIVEIWIWYQCGMEHHVMIKSGNAASGFMKVQPGFYATEWAFQIVKGGIGTSNFLVKVNERNGSFTLTPDLYNPYRPSYYTGFMMGDDEEVAYNNSRDVPISVTNSNCSSIEFFPATDIVTFSIINGSEYASLVDPVSG